MSPARVIIAIILISVGVFALLFVLLGLTVISGLTFTSLKLAVIIIFFWIASPVSSHLISNMIATVDRKKVLDMCELIEADNTTKENKKEQEKELK